MKKLWLLLALLIPFAWATPSFAAIALVSSRVDASTDSNGYTSGSIDTTGATLLTVVLSEKDTHGTLTDNKSNSWTCVAGPNSFSGTDGSICRAVNPTVGTGHTISISGTANFPSSIFAAWSGVDTSSPVDQTSAGASNIFTDTVAPGSITPSTNDQVVIVALGGINTATPTISGGLTIAGSNPGVGGQSNTSALAYVIQTTAGAVAPTWTSTGALTLSAKSMSFKSSGGGGGGSTLDGKFLLAQ